VGGLGEQVLGDRLGLEEGEDAEEEEVGPQEDPTDQQNLTRPLAPPQMLSPHRKQKPHDPRAVTLTVFTSNSFLYIASYSNTHFILEIQWQ
jgi:hypothetical protein